MDDWISRLPAQWTAGLGPEVFTLARCSYETPGRHYHSWEHASECLERIARFDCEAPRNVFLALLFHDAVYVPGRHDNEAASAKLARATLENYSIVPPPDIAAIERMILATHGHHAPPGADPDLKAVLDIDMSILGAEPDRYDRYADDVRSEYAPVERRQARYRSQRYAFLEGMLRRRRIFVTEVGFREWEGQARRNIAREMAAIRRCQGWAERAYCALCAPFRLPTTR